MKDKTAQIDTDLKSDTKPSILQASYEGFVPHRNSASHRYFLALHHSLATSLNLFYTPLA